MATASPVVCKDPTLAALDTVLALRALKESAEVRTYLGVSRAGDACARRLWYGWRWARPDVPAAKGYRAMQDGHRVEAVMADWLRLVPGLELHTVDAATGRQFAVEFLGGHVRGHLDGAVRGLAHAPDCWHVWECKAVGADRLRALGRLIEKDGEGAALAAWSPEYYAQAQLYMHGTGMGWHWCTVTSPGAREWLAVSTAYNAEHAEALVRRLAEIVRAAEPPDRCSEDPDWWQCKACAFRALCHEKVVTAQMSCRTCCHVTPVETGTWLCEKRRIQLDEATQRAGCDLHLFIPALVPWARVVDADESANAVTYQTEDGTQFVNARESARLRYPSSELQYLVPGLVGELIVEGIREDFDAKVIQAQPAGRESMFADLEVPF